MAAKVKKNLIYSILYQMLLMILPLVTAPYISRVVGAASLGTYTYTYSIAYYFVIAAMLGVNNYGNRSIATAQDDPALRSKLFWEIYSLQATLALMAIAVYAGYVALFVHEYRAVAWLQLIYIASALLDINWFFFGMEQFKLTVTRNTIIKILSVVCTFLFVRPSNSVQTNLIIYSLISVCNFFITNAVVWLFLKRYVCFVRVRVRDVLMHLKPNLLLFIPVIAVSVYRIMDKTMLGALSDSIQSVGFYEQAEKIINIPVAVITAIGSVMLPRISHLTASKNENAVRQYTERSMLMVMFFSCAFSFGLASVSATLIPLFLGEAFRESIGIVQILAPTLLFISWANIIRTQFLIPHSRDTAYVVSIVSGAVVNFIINSLLIHRFGPIGAAIGTLCAELLVAVLQTVFVRKDLPIGHYLRFVSVFLISGALMMGGVTLTGNFLASAWLLTAASPLSAQLLSLVVQVLVGAVLYIALCIGLMVIIDRPMAGEMKQLIKQKIIKK